MTPATDLTLEKTFRAPPEKVWRALTTPDLIRQWFAPRPVETREVRMDLRPGGAFFTLMVLPDGTEMGSEGCILSVDPGRELVFTDALRGGWRPNETPFMTARLRLAPVPEGTQYSVRVMHNDAEAKRRHEEMGFHEGWSTAADQLGEVAATL